MNASAFAGSIHEGPATAPAPAPLRGILLGGRPVVNSCLRALLHDLIDCDPTIALARDFAQELTRDDALPWMTIVLNGVGDGFRTRLDGF
jgi:hypothetical protein